MQRRKKILELRFPVVRMQWRKYDWFAFFAVRSNAPHLPHPENRRNHKTGEMARVLRMRAKNMINIHNVISRKYPGKHFFEETNKKAFCLLCAETCETPKEIVGGNVMKDQMTANNE